MIINYDYLREDQERCMLSPFYVLRYSSDAIFPAAQFSVFPGTDSARGCHAGFWQKVPPGLCSRLYPITIIYSNLYINRIKLCGSLLGYVCVFQSPFAMLCRWGSRPGRCISACFRCSMPLFGPIWPLDQPSQPSDHLFYKKNLAPLQVVKNKMK